MNESDSLCKKQAVLQGFTWMCCVLTNRESEVSSLFYRQASYFQNSLIRRREHPVQAVTVSKSLVSTVSGFQVFREGVAVG